MRTNWHKALLVSFVLITSSLAGCLNNDDDDEDMEGKYGTVIVSTYHIEQMVSAIAGDTLNVEMVSKNNIPVHDFEPSLEDIARLGDADLFLYHGLGLEPWVDDTLDSMGDDAPRFGSTHAMPTGEVDLDYESMLITDLCKLLTAGPYDSLYLSLDRDMNEFHAENVAFSLEAAEHDEDEHDEHDEDGHDEDEHDGHDEDEHDEHDEDGHDEDEHDGHDGHDEHNHGEAEERIMNPEGCPAESVISIFHLEEGEYIIEFESEHHDEEFNLAVLKMGGGHANHDHGDHDEDEHDEDEHDEDRHDEGEHDEDEHDEDRHDEDEHDEDEHDEHDEDGHDEDEHDEHDEDGHDDDESLTSTEMLELADTNNDSSISIDELREFIEMDEHDEICYNTISHIVTNDSEDSCGFYSYYENHSMNGQNFTGCYNTVTHDITGDNETVCGSYMLVENDHDDEEHDDECHIQHTEEEEIAMVTDIFNESDEDGNGLLDLSELENFIRHAHELDDCPEEIDEDLMGYATIHIGAEGEYGFAHSSELMMFILISDEHDSHGHDEHDEDGHDEHDEEMVCYNQSTHAVDESYTSEEDCESAGLMWTASNSGPDSHSDEDGHDEEGHDEDEHDEDGHVETLAYDPHSWLDPLAYKVQVGIVLDYLIDTFPDGEDAFIANANEFIEGLEDLDAAFEAALNDGTCTDKTVVANHNAYSYLAYRYDITFVTVHGLDPEGEPSPEDIAKVVEQIEENEITVLFVEEFTDQSSVQSLVEETGVTVEILYTMEMAPSDSDDDYMTMMNKNLESLVSGIGC